MLPVLQCNWQRCLTLDCFAHLCLFQIAQQLRTDLIQLFHKSQWSAIILEFYVICYPIFLLSYVIKQVDKIAELSTNTGTTGIFIKLTPHSSNTTTSCDQTLWT